MSGYETLIFFSKSLWDTMYGSHKMHFMSGGEAMQLGRGGRFIASGGTPNNWQFIVLQGRTIHNASFIMQNAYSFEIPLMWINKILLFYSVK